MQSSTHFVLYESGLTFVRNGSKSLSVAPSLSWHSLRYSFDLALKSFAAFSQMKIICFSELNGWSVWEISLDGKFTLTKTTKAKLNKIATIIIDFMMLAEWKSQWIQIHSKCSWLMCFNVFLLNFWFLRFTRRGFYTFLICVDLFPLANYTIDQFHLALTECGINGAEK